MEFDLPMLVKIVAYVVAIVAVVLGLRYRTDALEKHKVDKLACVGHHGEIAALIAELRSDIRVLGGKARVLQGGIKAMHEGFKAAGAIKNPPELPPEFYEDDEEDEGC